jgi:hypothetical protein
MRDLDVWDEYPKFVLLRDIVLWRLPSEAEYVVSGRRLRMAPRPTQFRGRGQHADLDLMAGFARGVPAPALTESLKSCALVMTRGARFSAVGPFDPAKGTFEIKGPTGSLTQPKRRVP